MEAMPLWDGLDTEDIYDYDKVPHEDWMRFLSNRAHYWKTLDGLIYHNSKLTDSHLKNIFEHLLKGGRQTSPELRAEARKRFGDAYVAFHLLKGG